MKKETIRIEVFWTLLFLISLFDKKILILWAFMTIPFMTIVLFSRLLVKPKNWLFEKGVK